MTKLTPEDSQLSAVERFATAHRNTRYRNADIRTLNSFYQDFVEAIDLLRQETGVVRAHQVAFVSTSLMYAFLSDMKNKTTDRNELNAYCNLIIRLSQQAIDLCNSIPKDAADPKEVKEHITCIANRMSYYKEFLKAGPIGFYRAMERSQLEYSTRS